MHESLIYYSGYQFNINCGIWGEGGVCIFENELLKMSLTTSKNQISANDLPQTIQGKKKIKKIKYANNSALQLLKNENPLFKMRIRTH